MYFRDKSGEVAVHGVFDGCSFWNLIETTYVNVCLWMRNIEPEIFLVEPLRSWRNFFFKNVSWFRKVGSSSRTNLCGLAGLIECLKQKSNLTTPTEPKSKTNQTYLFLKSREGYTEWISQFFRLLFPRSKFILLFLSSQFPFVIS
jgi:hypothetical protein